VNARGSVVGLCAALLAASACVPHAASALPTPIPQRSQTPPPDLALPSPTPVPLLVSGQVIDLERGYLVFASGDAFRLSKDARIVDSATGAAPTYDVVPGVYAVASLDPMSAQITLVRTSLSALAVGTPAAQIPRRFVAIASSPQPNPDLAPPQGVYTSRLSRNTLVTFTVQVPPNTPFADDVYMTTDTSGWNPQAIKMQRVDGLHFRIELSLAGGTRIAYLFTRGTWGTVERDRAGLERSARRIFVSGADQQLVDAQIFRWADLP